MEWQQNGDVRGEALAAGLGWLSIAVGLAEVAAPSTVARLIGVPQSERHTNTLRALGAREIGNGLAILAQPDRARWLWSRVGGDLVDVAYLGSALRAEGTAPRRIGAATAAVLGVTALDVLCAQQLRGRTNGRTAGLTARSTGVLVHHAITVNKPVDDVYRFWHDFQNFPRFMSHLESVDVIGERRSRWCAKGPAGSRFHWEAEIVEDRPNDRIAWRSVGRSWVQASGSVRFTPAPGGRGTEVRVQLQYTPPAGALGRQLAKLFGEEPEQQIRDDMRRFKQLAETGEIPLSEGPGLWRPARPPRRPEDVRALAGVQL
jgi:uncharacterized membrane protein